MNILKKYSVSLLYILLLVSCAKNPIVNENAQAARDTLNLADAYLERGDFAQAKAKLLLATRQAPHEAFVWNSWAYYADLTGEAEAADAYYRKAIHLQPRWGVFHNNYGVFLCRQGRYDRGIQQFILAVKDPSYMYPARAYHNAAVCATRQGDAKQAFFYEQQAVKDGRY